MQHDGITSTIALPPKMGEWYRFQPDAPHASSGVPRFEVIGHDSYQLICTKLQRVLDFLLGQCEEKFSVSIEKHAFSFIQQEFCSFNAEHEKQFLISRRSSSRLTYALYIEKHLALVFLSKILGESVLSDLSSVDLEMTDIFLDEMWALIGQRAGFVPNNFIADKTVGYAENNSMISANEGYYEFSCAVRISNSEIGKLSLAFNRKSLAEFEQHIPLYDGKPTIKLRPSVQKKILMKANAILGDATITLQDLLTMQEGDVIKLSKRVADPIIIKIGSELQFRGKLGRHKQYMAVKLNERILENDLDENLFSEDDVEQMSQNHEKTLASEKTIEANDDIFSDIESLDDDNDIQWDER